MESKVLVIAHQSKYAYDDGLQKKIEAALKDIAKKYKRRWFVHSAQTEMVTWIDNHWNSSRVTREFLRTAMLVLHQEQRNGKK